MEYAVVSRGECRYVLLSEASDDSKSKMPLMFSAIALTLAVIAIIIIGAVGLARSGSVNFVLNDGLASIKTSEEKGIHDEDKIWQIAIGYGEASFEYLDDASGEIKGFNVDIVNAVCKIARKNCELVADVFTNCWDSHAGESQRGGIGLHSKYYDACVSWIQSYVRTRTFKFSDPFSVNEAAVFFVKSGNPNDFDYQDITGQTIGFVDGFVYDEFCVARDSGILGTPIPAANLKHFTSRGDMLAAVLDGSVDAAFGNRQVWNKLEEVDVIPYDFMCSIAGRSMMMRKDNLMWEWWNPAFDILLQSPDYRFICQDLLVQHGHIPGPSPEELCINFQKR